MAKKQEKRTIADILYKGSYNVLSAMEKEKTVVQDFSLNNRKVKQQMQNFNIQKPFCTITDNTTDETIEYTKLTTETGKANFQKLLSIAKKVFEPALEW